MMPMVGLPPNSDMLSPREPFVPAPSAPRGPLARLVRNPNSVDGLPPYALADQSGRIQRFVEPTPDVDLESHVDRVVVVRHDTGRTLLASQLELPPLPLHPMLGAAHHVGDLHGSGMGRDMGTQALGAIQPAHFADDDDDTVQLLPNDEELPGGSTTPGDDPSSMQNVPENWSRRGPTNEPLHGKSSISSMPLDAAYGRLELIDPNTGMMGCNACPQCEGLPPGADPPCEGCPHCAGPNFPPEYGPPPGFGPGFRPMPQPYCRWYADVELNFIRTHLSDFVFGKLSEKYELSPRVIVGFKDAALLDGRVRYWHYGQDTPVLGDSAVNVELDVLDIEATHRFNGKALQVLLGGGLRVAGIDIMQDGAGAGADLLGMTFFIDGRAPLWSLADGRFSWIYGGRLSILGGDWGGDPSSLLVGGLIQDDNVVVHELHTGLDYAFRYEDVDFHIKAGFEMQNWHSDALSQNAGVDSLGFLGPGIQIGAAF
jgi:hypothetical protein